MTDAESLSALIGNVYDATLDAALWPNVLEKAAQSVRGSAASLYCQDPVSKTGNSTYSYDLDPDYVRLYFERYIKLNPTIVGYSLAEIGVPISTADVMPYEEFLRSRFYREWGQPQDLVDSAGAVLDRSGTTAAAFVVFRHPRNGPVDDEARRRMRLIVPHIRRAVLIGKVIDFQEAEAASFADTLDGVGAGIYLVDAAGRITHVNAAGCELLNKADPVHSGAGRLIVSDQEANRQLTNVFTAAGRGDEAVGVMGIAVVLTTRDGERYVAHVLPLTSGARRCAGQTYSAVAALFVHKAAQQTLSLPEAIVKAYKLTPAELRVLFAIVEVGGAPEVAEVLGIGPETIKTHLRHIYEKTGASRQVDLAKIVAGFSSALIR